MAESEVSTSRTVTYDNVNLSYGLNFKCTYAPCSNAIAFTQDPDHIQAYGEIVKYGSVEYEPFQPKIFITVPELDIYCPLSTHGVELRVSRVDQEGLFIEDINDWTDQQELGFTIESIEDCYM